MDAKQQHNTNNYARELKIIMERSNASRLAIAISRQNRYCQSTGNSDVNVKWLLHVPVAWQ